AGLGCLAYDDPARRLDHRPAIGENLLGHLGLVRPMGDVDLNHRDAPLILPGRTQRHPVVGVGQHLAEAGDIGEPRPELRCPLLELGTDPRLAHSGTPAHAADTALIAIAAHEAVAVFGDVAEAGDVEPVG